MSQIVWEAVQEGREETKREIAASLLENGISVDIIVKTTGLKKSEVLRIKKSATA